MGMPKGQKMDAEALKARRLEARRLLDEGVAQAEVARRLKTSRQSVSRWAQQPRKQLAQVRRQGRKAQLDEPARTKLRAALLAGAPAAGFAGELWTVPRVRQLIIQRFGTRAENNRHHRLSLCFSKRTRHMVFEFKIVGKFRDEMLNFTRDGSTKRRRGSGTLAQKQT